MGHKLVVLDFWLPSFTNALWYVEETIHPCGLSFTTVAILGTLF